MVLMETKFANHYYCQNRLGYELVCSAAIMPVARGAQGGVGLVIWDQPQGWSIELTRFHGPNPLIFEVFTGGKRNLIIVPYPTPPPWRTYQTWRRTWIDFSTKIPSC